MVEIADEESSAQLAWLYYIDPSNNMATRGCS